MSYGDMVFDSFDKAEKNVRLAHELYEDGRVSLALLKLEEAIEINPANGSWHFNKGLTLDSVSRFSDAIEEYLAALELNPDDLEILNSLAVDYTRTGMSDKAIETFEYIIQLDPEFEAAFCNRIIAYTEMGKYNDAEQMFYMGQQIDPDCALCFYNIGNSLFIQGKYDKAIYCWKRTSKIEPTHPQINFRIAQALWSKGDCENAHKYFLAELRINPGDIEVIFDFGLFLLNNGKIEQAREKFNRILEQDPEFAPAFLYLGEIALDSEDIPNAINLFHQALQMDNSLQGPRHHLTQFAVHDGHYEKARVYLLAEMELAPEDTNVLVSIASMFLAMGDAEFAANCLLKAIDADSSNDSAYYYLGMANALNGELEEAAEFFAHALDINSDNLLTLKDYAVVCLALERIEDAEQTIQKALAIDPNNKKLKTIESKIKAAQMKNKFADSCRKLIHPFKQ